MIALYILLGLLLLLLLPIGVRFRFHGEGRLVIRYAGIPVYTYSSADERKAHEPKEKAPKSDKKKAKGQKEEKENPIKRVIAQLKEEGIAGVVELVKEVTHLASGTMRRLFRRLHFGRCFVGMECGGAEAADIALKYGKLAGPLYSLRTLLLSHLRIRRLDWDIHPNFLAEKDTVTVDVRLHAYPLTLLGWGLRTALSALCMFMRFSNKKDKDGKDGKESQ